MLFKSIVLMYLIKLIKINLYMFLFDLIFTFYGLNTRLNEKTSILKRIPLHLHKVMLLLYLFS